MRSLRPFRNRDDILSLPVQPAGDSRNCAQSVIHIQGQIAQSSETAPSRVPCVADGAAGISLP